MARVEDRANALHASIEVRLELLGQLLARCFVGGILLVAERQPGVVHPPQVVGLVCLQQSLEKIGDAPRGRGVFSATGRQRAGNEREKRAIDQRVAVDEKKARRRRKCWRGGHTVNVGASRSRIQPLPTRRRSENSTARHCGRAGAGSSFVEAAVQTFVTFAA